MLDLRQIEVKGLDTEGLAAVILALLRERISGERPSRGEPSAWRAIVGFELSARWRGLYAEPGSGTVKMPGQVISGWDDNPPELVEAAQTAIEFLRHKGLIQQDPKQTHSSEFVVPTDTGCSIRVDTDPPMLALPRRAAWVQSRYASGVLQLTGMYAEGDVRSGTVFWTTARNFVTCAHNLALQDWSVHHPDLRLTSEHLASVRHPDESIDAACLHAKTKVVGGLEMEGLKLWHQPPRPGEKAFVMGYPAIGQRNPALIVKETTVADTEDYVKRVPYLTFPDQLAGGWSGGPVLNEAGYVIGIVAEQTALEHGTGSTTFGHAVPLAAWCDMLQES